MEYITFFDFAAYRTLIEPRIDHAADLGWRPLKYEVNQGALTEAAFRYPLYRTGRGAFALAHSVFN